MSDERVERAVREVQRAGLEVEVALRLCPVAYAVQSGEYDGYAVHAVFLSREEAEAHASNYSAEVREFPLLDRDGKRERGAWRAQSWLSGAPGRDNFPPSLDYDNHHLLRQTFHLTTYPTHYGPMAHFVAYGPHEQEALAELAVRLKEFTEKGWTEASWFAKFKQRQMTEIPEL